MITAGPTWVAIDKVRVISNIASGKTGFLLSEELKKSGARVTLVLGPVGEYHRPRQVKIIDYRYFGELEGILSKEIKTGKYDILIHAAAVSDFRPAVDLGVKIPSSKKAFNLKLAPTAKLIEKIKKLDPDIFLVGFKLQPQACQRSLLKNARGLIRKSRADLVVANTFNGEAYRAFIMDSKHICASVSDKKAMARKLVEVLESIFK